LPKFRFFFVSASYREKKFRYFSIYFFFKFKIQQISTKIHRNSPKFRNEISFPLNTGISSENEMINSVVDSVPLTYGFHNSEAHRPVQESAYSTADETHPTVGADVRSADATRLIHWVAGRCPWVRLVGAQAIRRRGHGLARGGRGATAAARARCGGT